jgi:hypothetical protein
VGAQGQYQIKASVVIAVLVVVAVIATSVAAISLWGSKPDECCAIDTVSQQGNTSSILQNETVIASQTTSLQTSSSGSCPYTTTISEEATDSTSYFSCTSTATTVTTSSSASALDGAWSNELYPLPSSNFPDKTIYVVSDYAWENTLTALQGLVARQAPQIFYIGNSLDSTYLNMTAQEYSLNTMRLSTQQALEKFIPGYVSETNGSINVVVFDSNELAGDYYWETNTARTIAGVTDALPIGSSQLAQFEAWFPNTNVLYNLTSPTICSGCAETSAGAVAGYQWAWNTFGPETTRQFFTLSPYGRPMGGDYEVEFKSFVWSMCDPDVATGCTFDASQQAIASTILNAYPAGTVAMGFFGLGGEACSDCTISLLSERGMIQDNSELSTNLSFYSGLPPLHNVNQPQAAMDQGPSYNKSMTYVMWSFSQGDADTYEFYTTQRIYQEIDPATGVPFRDEIPVNIQLKTVMAQTAPPVLSLYYDDPNSLADFMSAPSGGAGYQHMEVMSGGTGVGSEYWYAQLSKSLDSNVGVNNIFLIWGPGGGTNQELEQFISNWGNPSPSAIFMWAPQGHAPMICNAASCGTTLAAGGLPVMYASFWQPNCQYAGVGSGNTCSVSSTVSQIIASGQFVYIIMNTQYPGYQFIHDVMQALGSGYQAVNSQQFACIYLESLGGSC